ncbi:MAG: 1-phosphofructokinase family hexose kinase, partial [Ilumatobacteraceae bacterium]
MVAAIAIALGRGESLVEVGRFGVAAGTAAVLANSTGLCCRSDVERLL